jgi:glycosyltransferase involved in cell wall biosynthesis
VEALALGTPLIATWVGGVPEIVTDGVNGLLVPPSSPDALAQALRRFLGSEELRTRLAGAARSSVEHLSAPLVYGRIEELLAEAVAR